jgi:DNA transformation protein
MERQDTLSETAQHIVDLLRRWGPVGAKRMFGGVGLYRGGVMFGLIAGDSLYLKVDDRNAAEYEARGLEPFRYDRSGRMVALSYRETPPELLDDAETLVAWSRAAWDAAQRSASHARRVHARVR